MEVKAIIASEAAGGSGLQSVQGVAAPGQRARLTLWLGTGDAWRNRKQEKHKRAAKRYITLQHCLVYTISLYAGG